MLSASRRSLLLQAVAGGALALAGYAAGWHSASTRGPGARGAIVSPSGNGGAGPSGSLALPAAAAPGSDSAWEGRWSRITAQPHSPDADAAAAAALEEMAGRDPARALSIALKETNLHRRADWLHAALRGWGGADPTAAAAWIANLPPAEQEEAEGAVMDGAVRTPAAAEALALQLMQADPAAARSHANHLLSAFSRTGDYSAGVDFASSLPGNLRSEMLGTAYQYWALAQPQEALSAAAQVPEGDSRTAALDAALSGWSQVDPSGLANYALGLPPGKDRTQAFQTALSEWVQLNPGEASAWMNNAEPKPEFDAGVAAVALQPQVIASHPDIAAGWAESISDPALRSSTLVAVLRNWASGDPAAARAYVATCANLQSDDRASLLAGLGTAPAAP